jgi:hypothetical protein
MSRSRSVVSSGSSSDGEFISNIPTVLHPQENPPPSNPPPSTEDFTDLPEIPVFNSVPEPLATFGLTRDQKSSIRGKRFYFTFYSEGALLFRAKAKGRNPSDPIAISQQREVHLRGECDFYLIPQNSSTFFSLRKEAADGVELMNVTIHKTSPVLAMPVHLVVEIMSEMGVSAMRLVSKRAKMTMQGEWKLDFGRRFAVPSEKNSIFVIDDERADRELVMVRKIRSAAYEIDLAERIPRIAGFAIGLALCLGKFG